MQLLSLAFRLQLLSWPRLHHFECNFFALVSAHRTPKGLSIVGINSRVLPGAADRHIELFSIHQLSAAHLVDIDYHTVHRGAGTAAARSLLRRRSITQPPGAFGQHHVDLVPGDVAATAPDLEQQLKPLWFSSSRSRKSAGLK